MSPTSENDRAELMQLNQQTFAAEERRDVEGMGWREFLEGVLDPRFTIRRSRADVPNQSRDEMIEWIAKSTVAARTIREEDAVVWRSDTLGVVTCPVEMQREGALHRYQNVKVFAKKPGESWRCVYWQVSESPVAPPTA